MTENKVLKQMQQIALEQNHGFNNVTKTDKMRSIYQFKLIDCISKITVGKLILHLN